MRNLEAELTDIHAIVDSSELYNGRHLSFSMSATHNRIHVTITHRRVNVELSILRRYHAYRSDISLVIVVTHCRILIISINLNETKGLIDKMSLRKESRVVESLETNELRRPSKIRDSISG